MVERRRTKGLLDKEREIHKKMKLKLDGAILERIVSFCFVLFDEIVELCSDNFLYPLSRSHRMRVTGQLLQSVSFVWSLLYWPQQMKPRPRQMKLRPLFVLPTNS